MLCTNIYLFLWKSNLCVVQKTQHLALITYLPIDFVILQNFTRDLTQIYLIIFNLPYQSIININEYNIISPGSYNIFFYRLNYIVNIVCWNTNSVTVYSRYNAVNYEIILHITSEWEGNNMALIWTHSSQSCYESPVMSGIGKEDRVIMRLLYYVEYPDSAVTKNCR